MKIRWLWTICVLFMFAVCSNFTEVSTTSFYNLNVKIEPSFGKIFVNGTIKVHGDETQDSLKFHLHETFDIERLTVNGQEVEVSCQEDEPFFFIPASKIILVELPEITDRREILLEIAYQGELKDYPEIGTHEDQEWALDDQINSRMVELASYSRWYPLFDRDALFDIDMKVTMPVEWKCVCSGEMVEEKRTEQNYISRWISESDFDIVIVGAPNLKYNMIDTPAGKVEFYYTQLPEEFIQKESKEVENTLKLYTDLLGKPNFSKKIIKHIYSPKKKGMGRAGYMRPGIIVTSEGRTLDHLKADPDFSFLHDVAHEIAHFWWAFAAGQGDWINETFAEYFSLIAVQKIESEDAYRNVLGKYKDRVMKLPEDAASLSTVPPVNDQVGYVVRYFKGSLMLDRIREQIGEEIFFRNCRDFYQEFKDEHIGTNEFRRFWGDLLGDHKKLMEIWIESKGGLPKLKSEKHTNSIE